MGVEFNLATGKVEYVPDSSLTLKKDPLMQTNVYSPAKQGNNNLGQGNNSLGIVDSIKAGLSALTDPIGTGENARNGLDYLSTLGGTLFDIWKTNKALGLANNSYTLQKNALISNLTNNAATGIANSGQVVTMARAFNEDYGNQLAQNYGNMAQTLTNAVGAAGGDTSGLQTQTNNLRNGLQKYSALA